MKREKKERTMGKKDQKKKNVVIDYENRIT